MRHKSNVKYKQNYNYGARSRHFGVDMHNAPEKIYRLSTGRIPRRRRTVNRLVLLVKTIVIVCAVCAVISLTYNYGSRVFSVFPFSSFFDSTLDRVRTITGHVNVVSSPSNVSEPHLPIFNEPLASKLLSFNSLTRASSCSLRHEVGKGDTLSSIAGKYGFPSTIATQLHDAISKVKIGNDSASKLSRGQIIEFRLRKPDGIYEVIFDRAPDGYVLVSKNADGSFSGVFNEIPSTKSERVVFGQIDSSFAAAATKQSVPYSIIDDLVDLVGDKILFHKDFRKGDFFTLIYPEIHLADGTSLSAGPLLAALLSVNGKKFAVIRYVGVDGKARYFDQDGEALGDHFLRYPVKFSRISSVFSDSRLHPVTRRLRPHHGVDFAASVGTPVRASADGVVEFAGYKGANGNMIRIRHSDKYTTTYLHLSRIDSEVKKGERVIRGQQIGAVGSTGLSTGPHLHYGFFVNGKYIDPLSVELPMAENLTKGNNIPQEYHRRALQTLEYYQTDNKVS